MTKVVVEHINSRVSFTLLGKIWVVCQSPGMTKLKIIVAYKSSVHIGGMQFNCFSIYL